MVRENPEIPTSKGFDADKGVRLDDELEKAGKAQKETVDPEHTMTREPIAIKGDYAPEKQGSN